MAAHDFFYISKDLEDEKTEGQFVNGKCKDGVSFVIFYFFLMCKRAVPRYHSILLQRACLLKERLQYSGAG